MATISSQICILLVVLACYFVSSCPVTRSTFTENHGHSWSSAPGCPQGAASGHWLYHVESRWTARCYQVGSQGPCEKGHQVDRQPGSEIFGTCVQVQGGKGVGSARGGRKRRGTQDDERIMMGRFVQNVCPPGTRKDHRGNCSPPREYIPVG